MGDSGSASTGSYFPLAPQIATGLSFPDYDSPAGGAGSSVWSPGGSVDPRRPGTAVYPIGEEGSGSGSDGLDPVGVDGNYFGGRGGYMSPPPTTPRSTQTHARRMSWRGTGSWSSGLGGWLGGSSGRKSVGGSTFDAGGGEREGAKEKLERVLSHGSGTDRKYKNKGKGMAVPPVGGGGW